jgi:hypothetical protein
MMPVLWNSKTAPCARLSNILREVQKVRCEEIKLNKKEQCILLAEARTRNISIEIVILLFAPFRRSVLFWKRAGKDTLSVFLRQYLFLRLRTSHMCQVFIYFQERER